MHGEVREEKDTSRKRHNKAWMRIGRNGREKKGKKRAREGQVGNVISRKRGRKNVREEKNASRIQQNKA